MPNKSSVYFACIKRKAVPTIRVIPFVYALLPNKQQTTYARFFDVLFDDHVIRAFESLSENFPLDAPVQAIIDYFEDTYIGRLRPGGQCRDSLLPVTVWNMYAQTLQGLPRTNNAVEGWHRSFQANVGGCHPNFWKFIDILK